MSGETTFNPEKHLGIEMYTGIEPGVVTVFYKNKECSVPMSNCKMWVYEGEKKEDANRMGGDKHTKAEPKESK